MAQEVMKELKYDGSKVVVEVARRDAKGNTIDTTYATLTAVNAKLDTSAFNTYIGTTAPSTYVAIKDFKTNYLDKNSVAYQSDITSVKTELSQKITSVEDTLGNQIDNLDTRLDTNYYDKTETYSKDEVNDIIESVEVGEWQVVTSLPTTGEEGVVYLVGTAQPYDMYIWENSAWLKIGTTQIDLSGYVPTSRTVNGHALTSNVTVTKSDVGLGSVNNAGWTTVVPSSKQTNDMYFTMNGAYYLQSDLQDWCKKNILTQLVASKGISITTSSTSGISQATFSLNAVAGDGINFTYTGNELSISNKITATDVSIG